MDTRNTKLPEVRINENSKNRQLTAIIHNTARWMGFLAHEFNGFFTNIDWVSRLLQEEMDAESLLPKETFGELNRITQENTMAFKTVHHYFQLMNSIAQKEQYAEDMITFDASLLLKAVPGIDPSDIQYGSLAVEVPQLCARVTIFLLDKIFQLVVKDGLEQRRMQVSFDVRERNWLHICVSGSELFWRHGLWKQRISAPADQIPAEPKERIIQMFYEMLTLVDGTIISEYTQPLDCSKTVRSPRIAGELIQREISARYLEFSVPFELEKGVN